MNVHFNTILIKIPMPTGLSEGLWFNLEMGGGVHLKANILSGSTTKPSPILTLLMLPCGPSAASPKGRFLTQPQLHVVRKKKVQVS